MKIINDYSAIASCDLHHNATVIMEDGICRPLNAKDFPVHATNLYSVMDQFVAKGQLARLAGDDTVMYIGYE